MLFIASAEAARCTGTTAELQGLADDVKRVEGHTNIRARQSGVEVWKQKIINEFEPSVMTSDMPDGKLPANSGRRKKAVTSLLTFNTDIKHGGWLGMLSAR